MTTLPLAKKKPARRDYRDANGNKLPSVTEILKNLGWKGDGLVGWAYNLGCEAGVMTGALEDAKKLALHRQRRDKAADDGSCAHDMVAADLGGEPFDGEKYTQPTQAVARPNADRITAWCREHLDIIDVEKHMVDEIMGFGGTCDIHARRKSDGVECVIDIKTSKGVYDETILQLAGYATLINRRLEGGIIHAQVGEPLVPYWISWKKMLAGGVAFEALRRIETLRKEIKVK